MSEWATLSKGNACEAFARLKDRIAAGDSLAPDSTRLTAPERAFREMFLRSAETAMSKYPNSNAGHWYLWGLNVGIDMVKFFEGRKMPLLLWDAYDPQMWMHLSLNVVPDVIHRLSEFRDPSPEVFYSRPNRMLLRKAWWYVYLSMKTDGEGKIDVEGTRNRLEPLRDQDAKDLLDRSAGGYHIDFTRDMMARYTEYCVKHKVTGQEREEFFQALIREHHLRLQFTLPELEGYKEYFDAILSHAERVINRWVEHRAEIDVRRQTRQEERTKLRQQVCDGEKVGARKAVSGSTIAPAGAFVQYLKRKFAGNIDVLVANVSKAKSATDKIDRSRAERDTVLYIIAKGELDSVRSFVKEQMAEFLRSSGRRPQVSDTVEDECFNKFLNADWEVPDQTEQRVVRVLTLPRFVKRGSVVCIKCPHCDSVITNSMPRREDTVCCRKCGNRYVCK